MQRGRGGIKDQREKFWLPVPALSLAHGGTLGNLFTSLDLNCHICYLVVMDFYLPGRALVLINKVRMKYRSSALARSRCHIEMLILFFEMWFLLPTG